MPRNLEFRRFSPHALRTAATTLALSALLLTLAPAATRADEEPAAEPSLNAPGLTTPIKWVVVIFQENVSFDHYFATYPFAANLSGEPAFTPLRGAVMPSVNGLTPGLLLHNPNSVQPFRLSRSQNYTCDQDHNYTPEQLAFNGGLMNKFVENTGVGGAGCPDYGFGPALTMGYYDGNTVTALWNYAQHFAMSDNSYGTTFGPSTPGALNLISGMTAPVDLAHTKGSLAGSVSGNAVVGDPDPFFDDCGAFTQIGMLGQNVGDLLNAKGVTWGWFEGGFTPSSVKPDGTAVCAAATPNLGGSNVGDYSAHHQPFQYYASTANIHHLPPSSIPMIGHTDQANHQYDLSYFFRAARRGSLPAVSFLKAKRSQDGHAAYSSPLDEQKFLVDTINHLQSLPEWQNMAIIIAWDDSDGWYDHQMPPIMNPSAGSADGLNGPGVCGSGSPMGGFNGRCGYGPRLPLLVISPWAKANFVDHSVTDQSSVLRFIEDNWQLGRIGNGSYDAIAGPLNNMFDFRHAPANTPLMLNDLTGQPVAQ